MTVSVDVLAPSLEIIFIILYDPDNTVCTSCIVSIVIDVRFDAFISNTKQIDNKDIIIFRVMKNIVLVSKFKRCISENICNLSLQ